MALLNKYRYHNHHGDYPPAELGHPGLDPGSFGSLKNSSAKIFIVIQFEFSVGSKEFKLI